MKVLSVLRAESVRAVRTIGGTLGYLPEASALLVERYKFIGIPTNEELLGTDPNKGITFKQGKWESNQKTIAIDFLQVLPMGISVVTHTNTSDSDAILEDTMSWAQSQFNLEFESIKPGIGHASQLEVRLEKQLPDLFPFLKTISSSITESLDDFWDMRPRFELININFWVDKTKFPFFAPSIFRLDRRSNIPFEHNVYYSEAPLSTNNHVMVLSKLERVCLETFGLKSGETGVE
jgi:hypothetical protein